MTSFGESSSALAPKCTVAGFSSCARDAIRATSAVRNRAENFDGATIAEAIFATAATGSSRGNCPSPMRIPT